MTSMTAAADAPNAATTQQRTAAAEPSALRQIRESAQALLAGGKVDEAFEFVVSALDAVLRKTRDLELLVAKLRRQQAAKRSERMDAGQLQLLFEVLCSQTTGADATVAAIDPEAEAREDAELDREIKEAEQAQGPEKNRRKHRGGVRTGTVERQVHHHEVPEAERKCEKCGLAKDRIGEDITRVLEYVPGHFVEHEHHRDKFACGKCKDGVATAPGPDKIIDRSPADASVLAHVVVSKIEDHCPLHRLHRIYLRSGVNIPVSTMSDWMGEVADLFRPLADRLEARILASYIDQMDATGVRVLDSASPENIERGTMWCYVGDERDVVSRYTPTGEGATGPWCFLAGRTGYVQADAANVFDRIFNGQVASAVEVGCWSHGRRKLADLRDTDCRVAYPLKLIARLYRVEHLADAQGTRARPACHASARTLSADPGKTKTLAARHPGQRPPGLGSRQGCGIHG
jgi:transposase